MNPAAQEAAQGTWRHAARPADPEGQTDQRHNSRPGRAHSTGNAVELCTENFSSKRASDRLPLVPREPGAGIGSTSPVEQLRGLPVEAGCRVEVFELKLFDRDVIVDREELVERASGEGGGGP